MLDIIYRSCSRPESQVHGDSRIVTKQECTHKCLKSIVESAKWLNVEHKITVVDDHSYPDVIYRMKKLLRSQDFFIDMKETGNGESLDLCYNYADEECDDLIYFVEDDYLHEPDALSLMVGSYYDFRSHLGNKEVSIFPLDCNDRYRPDWMEPCFVVPGRDRYWRTVYHTTGTFMLHKSVFSKNRIQFKMFTFYGKDPNIHESTTINKIWTSGEVFCFSPIPSLVYHLQLLSHLPFYTDWTKLWGSIT